jgi:hypothetical protein
LQQAAITCGVLPRAELQALENSHNNFERGQTDTFALRAPDVGVLEKVKVVFKPRGLFPDWHLARVEIQKGPSDRAVFPFNQWIKKAGEYELDRASVRQAAGDTGHQLEYRVSPSIRVLLAPVSA